MTQKPISCLLPYHFIAEDLFSLLLHIIVLSNNQSQRKLSISKYGYITFQEDFVLVQGESILNLLALYILHPLRSFAFASESQPWQTAPCRTLWLPGEVRKEGRWTSVLSWEGWGNAWRPESGRVLASLILCVSIWLATDNGQGQYMGFDRPLSWPYTAALFPFTVAPRSAHLYKLVRTKRMNLLMFTLEGL